MMISKEEKVTNAVKQFESSNQNIEDYMALFMVIQNITRQGSGLMWSQIQASVKLGLLLSRIK